MSEEIGYLINSFEVINNVYNIVTHLFLLIHGPLRVLFWSLFLLCGWLLFELV